MADAERGYFFRIRPDVDPEEEDEEPELREGEL
jgi:hypothetical protein